MKKLIQEFIKGYQREYDFYSNLSLSVAKICDEQLRQAGIRCIVTNRAKSPNSLQTKLESRDREKRYKKTADIYKDIVDLAGVRIALYFPREMEETQRILEENFIIDNTVLFPKPRVKSERAYVFSGYSARHYRVYLKGDTIEKRYANSLVEIQVASVLMHAWAEVEHDLAYKPNSGELSEEEYAILDKLNGLVLSGEIALGLLQDAGKRRASLEERSFSNHFELASYLHDWAEMEIPDCNVLIGRADLLLKMLEATKQNSPTALQPYLKYSEDDSLPLSQRIIENLLNEYPDLIQLYFELRGALEPDEPLFGVSGDSYVASLGEFLNNWIQIEKTLRGKYQDTGGKPGLGVGFAAYSHWLIEGKHISTSAYTALQRLSKMRNYIVHGIEQPSKNELQLLCLETQEVLKELENI